MWYGQRAKLRAGCALGVKCKNKACPGQVSPTWFKLERGTALEHVLEQGTVLVQKRVDERLVRIERNGSALVWAADAAEAEAHDEPWWELVDMCTVVLRTSAKCMPGRPVLTEAVKTVSVSVDGTVHSAPGSKVIWKELGSAPVWAGAYGVVVKVGKGAAQPLIGCDKDVSEALAARTPQKSNGFKVDWVKDEKALLEAEVEGHPKWVKQQPKETFLMANANPEGVVVHLDDPMRVARKAGAPMGTPSIGAVAGSVNVVMWTAEQGAVSMALDDAEPEPEPDRFLCGVWCTKSRMCLAPKVVGMRGLNFELPRGPLVEQEFNCRLGVDAAGEGVHFVVRAVITDKQKQTYDLPFGTVEEGCVPNIDTATLDAVVKSVSAAKEAADGEAKKAAAVGEEGEAEAEEEAAGGEAKKAAAEGEAPAAEEVAEGEAKKAAAAAVGEEESAEGEAVAEEEAADGEAKKAAAAEGLGDLWETVVEAGSITTLPQVELRHCVCTFRDGKERVAPRRIIDATTQGLQSILEELVSSCPIGSVPLVVRPGPSPLMAYMSGQTVGYSRANGTSNQLFQKGWVLGCQGHLGPSIVRKDCEHGAVEEAVHCVCLGGTRPRVFDMSEAGIRSELKEGEVLVRVLDNTQVVCVRVGARKAKAGHARPLIVQTGMIINGKIHKGGDGDMNTLLYSTGHLYVCMAVVKPGTCAVPSCTSMHTYIKVPAALPADAPLLRARWCLECYPNSGDVAIDIVFPHGLPQLKGATVIMPLKDGKQVVVFRGLDHVKWYEYHDHDETWVNVKFADHVTPEVRQS
jgi:hypothetical protein